MTIHRHKTWQCLTSWLFLILTRLTLSADAKMAVCGGGPYLIQSVPVDVYVSDGTSTVLTTKTIAQMASGEANWIVRPPALRDEFDKNSVKEKNNTRLTLTMTQTLDGVEVSYQLNETSKNGRATTFRSAVATIKLGGHAAIEYTGQYSNKRPIRAVYGTTSAVICFTVSKGAVSEATLFKEVQDLGSPVDKSLYSYVDDCIRMGPLRMTDSGHYYVSVKNCFETYARVPFVLQVEAPTTLAIRSTTAGAEQTLTTILPSLIASTTPGDVTTKRASKIIATKSPPLIGPTAPSIVLTSFTGTSTQTAKTNPQLVYVKIYSTVTVGYTIKGKLSHRVKVFQNKHRVSDTTKPNLSISLSNTTITNATMADAGLYMILVRNEKLKSSIQFTLIIDTASDERHPKVRSTERPPQKMSGHTTRGLPTMTTDAKTHPRTQIRRNDFVGVAGTATLSRTKTAFIKQPTKKTLDQTPSAFANKSTVKTMSSGKVTGSESGLASWAIALLVIVLLTVCIVTAALIYRYRAYMNFCIMCHNNNAANNYWSVQPSARSNTYASIEVISKLGSDDIIPMVPMVQSPVEESWQTNPRNGGLVSNSGVQLPELLADVVQVSAEQVSDHASSGNHNGTISPISETCDGDVPGSKAAVERETSFTDDTEGIYNEIGESRAICEAEDKNKNQPENSRSTESPQMPEKNVTMISDLSDLYATVNKIRKRAATVASEMPASVARPAGLESGTRRSDHRIRKEKKQKKENSSETDDSAFYAKVGNKTDMLRQILLKRMKTSTAVSDPFDLYARVNENIPLSKPDEDTDKDHITRTQSMSIDLSRRQRISNGPVSAQPAGTGSKQEKDTHKTGNKRISCGPKPALMPKPALITKPAPTPKSAVNARPAPMTKPALMPKPAVTPKPALMPKPPLTPKPALMPKPHPLLLKARRTSDPRVSSPLPKQQKESDHSTADLSQSH